jgi:hypothetical protein
MFSAITSMLRAKLKYVGTHPGVPEELILDPEEGKKENGIVLGRNSTVSPALFGEDLKLLPQKVELSTIDAAKKLTTAIAQISQSHCSFKLVPSKGWTVTDMSRNGTAISTPTDSTSVFTRIAKQYHLRHGDLITFGGCGATQVGKSIFQYKFELQEPDSVEGTSTPPILQKLLDSLTETEGLKLKLQSERDQNFILKRDIERVERQRDSEREQKDGLIRDLERVKKELETERFVLQQQSKAMNACKQELSKVQLDVQSERVLKNELQRTNNKLEDANKRLELAYADLTLAKRRRVQWKDQSEGSRSDDGESSPAPDQTLACESSPIQTLACESSPPPDQTLPCESSPAASPANRAASGKRSAQHNGEQRVLRSTKLAR